MEFENLRIAINEGGWAEVTLHRPEVLNALNLAMVTDLDRALTALERNPDVKGMILTGAGDKAFVAGADIAELLHRTVDQALEGINARLFQRVEDFPWPTIAAIHGYALGGGCELALSCDIRIGTPDTVMGQPEVKLGIIPGAGGPHRLSRTVGPGIARELIFTGRIVDAAEAHRIGLLNHVYPADSLLDEARTLMGKIRKNSELAVRLSKLALNASANSVDRRNQMIEMISQGILFESQDKTARMTRFLDRKKNT